VLRKNLAALSELSADELIQDRYQKFRALGVFSGR
jgi:acetyl-CoA carboxylase carboxyl transferase subunit alpha